ncbi:MAG: hypothetical protein Q9195_008930 [Heterodermia aff. obscurata]
MPSTTVESQFAFLISCIRHANNGKVDFDKVAKECNVTSKGAAAKRYERLMKANGLHQPAHSNRDVPISSAPRKNPSDSSDKGKKRTFAEHQSEADNGDDDEELPKGKTEPKSESAKEERRNSVMVKQEVSQMDGAYDVPMDGVLQYSQVPGYFEDEKLFNNGSNPRMFKDESESKHAEFAKMDYGSFEMNSVGLAAQSSKEMSDSIVIAD